MSGGECGIVINDCKIRTGYDRRRSLRGAPRQAWMLLVAGVLGAALPAQVSNLGGAQSSNAQDCADPLLAGSAPCAGQNQEQFNPFSGSQTRSALLPADGNYSDVEQFNRQAPIRNAVQQTLLPPEPPTEFQSFIYSATGQSLPIYGANLFRSVPSTFAPLDMAPVPPDYVLGPGDELRIRVWGQVNFQANLRVDRSGEVFVPQVGTVHVAGIPFSRLNAHLREAIGRVYHNFDLTADVGQIRAIQVYVAGAARRPGVYTVSSLSTLVDALFSSGGPSLQGSMRRIEVRRANAVVTNFDLYKLLIEGDKSKDAKLESGDVIFIPSVGPQAAVTGSVRNQAIYELVANEPLGSLLADAGGVSSVAAEARVSIERIEEHRDRQAMEVAYDAAGLKTPVADGDLVRVYSIVPAYLRTVILRGNIANAGRFAWHPGMRIGELIPDRESLVTRNYWWKRARLGIPGPEEADEITQPDLQGRFQNQNQNENSPQNTGQNLSAQQRNSGSSLAAAEKQSSGNRVFAPAERTQIREIAPEIDWDYAVIERLDRETLKAVVIPFDLGRLVEEHDASQDLELEAGDVVSIFSQADIRVPIAHQTKRITLDGEFPHAGVYTAQPGETLRHLVERAGGLTPNAYLYGSEFTRETTRAVQQARIDEYLQSLGMQVQRGSLGLTASAASSQQDLSRGAAAQTGEQDLLASLRQIRATGRIVLRFAPDSSGAGNIPDLPLEDGDRFTVPPVPSSVNVVGSVYDQNSFLYLRPSRAGTYLRIAGGATRDADRGHEFIIRADGEVVSRLRDKGLWSGGDFDNLRINPGDTIVVPEKSLRPSALRALVDWSQMFSQLALGSAAVSVLK